ncbi:MAG: tetratricopeptide repeat protein, partial [Deltaproteobacteria bacterium]|nr:tetratricopeptide repeat protein [Deltaproteobacteria bacterium]
PYMALGRLYAATKRTDKAVAEFQEAIKRNPKAITARMSLGVLYESQGKYDAAQKEYREILKTNPKFVPAANNLAWNLAEHGGNIDEALTLAQMAKEQNPEDPGIADTLGWIYYKKNIVDRAIREFEDAIKKIPNHPSIHYHLGMAYLKKGDKTKAKAELTKALGISRAFPEAKEAEKALAGIR